MSGQQTNFLDNVNQKLSDLLKRKSKREKKKQEVRLISRQKTLTYKPSKRQEIINKMFKRNVGSVDEVMAVLINEGMEVKREDAVQYYNIAKIRAENGRIIIPDNLIKGDIIYNVVRQGEKPKIQKITSDLLYWANMVYQDLTQTARKYLDLDTARIVSNRALIYKDTKTIEEKYINDFNVDVSCPFFDRRQENDSDIDKAADKYIKNVIFYYNGVKYLAISSDVRPGQDLYLKEGYSAKKALKIIQQAEELHTEGDTLRTGIKKIDKSGGAYYFEKTIKPTTFCPSTLDLKQSVESTIMYSFKIRPDEYINTMIEQKAIKPEPGMFTFKNMENFFVLFDILVQALKLGEDSGIALLLKEYRNKKSAFNAIKKHYMDFERIVLNFLDSFNNRINVDRLTELLKKVNSYLVDDDILVASSVEIDAIRNVLSFDTNATKLMLNFLSTSTRTTISYIKHVLEEATLPGQDTGTLEVDIRSAAKMCFDFLLTGDNPCISTIKSPSVFLGNTVGDYSTDNLKMNTQQFIARMELLRKTDDEINNQVQQVAQQAAENAQNNILRELASNIDDPAKIKNVLIQKGYLNEYGKPLLSASQTGSTTVSNQNA